MEKIFVTSSNTETMNLGEKLGSLLTGGDTVLLDGDLGAGKTTFTKGIGRAMGVEKVINSPTFTIVKEYRGKKFILYHLDLYRLDGVSDDFDLEEYFCENAVSVCEWPFIFSDILPNEYIKVLINRISDSTRKITITCTKKYEDLVGEL